MQITDRPAPRRTESLSKARIVEVAITILDVEGESALTFRALAARLGTGSGALYWHVADKEALLAAAADRVVAEIADAVEGLGPRDAVRSLALGVFDALGAHPWVGGQLSRNPWQEAVVRILEGIGGRIQALGLPEHALFNAVTAVMSFILGAAGQYAAAVRIVPRDADRTAVLAGVAARWEQLDPALYPFTRQVAAQLPGHDDREQFAAGIDLILSGIANLVPGSGPREPSRRR